MRTSIRFREIMDNLQPQQMRSQQTLDRILQSSTQLIAQHSYSDVTITQIAKHANISVGGFYSRFENKESLFTALKERFIEDTREQLEAAIEEMDRFNNLRTLLTFVISRNAQLYERYRGVLIATHLEVRVFGSAKEKNNTTAYNATIVDQLEKLLLSRRDEITHRQPRVAIRSAIACLSAMLKDAIVFGNLDPYPTPKNSKTVVRQVTNVVHGYLTAENQ